MINRFSPAAIVVTVGAAVLGASVVSAQSAATPVERIAAAWQESAARLGTVVAALLQEPEQTCETVALALTAANVPTDAAAFALKPGCSADRIVAALVAAAPADQKVIVQAAASLATSPTAAGNPSVPGATAAGAPAAAGFTSPSSGGGGGSSNASTS